MGALGIGLAVLFSGPGREARSVTLILIALGLFNIVYAIVRWDQGLHLAWAYFERAILPTTWTFSPGGVRVVTAHGDCDFRWEGFERFVETRRLFLLYRRSGPVWIIPKRALAEDSGRAALQKMLQERLTPHVRAFPVVPVLGSDHNQASSRSLS